MSPVEAEVFSSSDHAILVEKKMFTVFQRCFSVKGGLTITLMAQNRYCDCVTGCPDKLGNTRGKEKKKLGLWKSKVSHQPSNLNMALLQ